MSAATGYLLRICVGGICCACAITLSGEGAKREITRFCCACIMLILCFSCIKQIDLGTFDRSYGSQVQDQVDQALADSAEAQRLQVDASLEQQIENQARTLGVVCTAEVQSALDGGVYTVTRVTLYGADGQNILSLCSWITDQMGVSGDKIIKGGSGK